MAGKGGIAVGSAGSVGGVDGTPAATEPTPSQSRPVTVALSDFLRPGMILDKVFYQFSRVEFVGGETLILARMNAERVGVFFGHNLPAVNNLVAGLNDDGEIAPILWVPGQTTAGGTLADFLSLVCGEWLGTLPAAGTVYVTELIRRS